MRTGSNLLEAALNAVPGVACLGELYNPVFVGYPKRPVALGYDLAMREADPDGLFKRLRDGEGLSGFRWFHDHDPRAFNLAMADSGCAKIVLLRRPLDSYVSLKIARQTGQWKLGDLKNRKDARIVFDAAEFAAYLADWQDYQTRIRKGLQESGQTAFVIDYDDLGALDVLNGLLAFLGVAGRLAKLPSDLVPQNPGPMSDKVENHAAMCRALAEIDPFGANAAGLGEPRIGPGVPRFMAAETAPILFLPVAGNASARVQHWLAEIGDTGRRGVRSGFTQGTLRQWMRDNPTHFSFSLVVHPLQRAFDAFATATSLAPDALMRVQLLRSYKLDLPEAQGVAALAPRDLRELFLRFLKIVKGSLDGQTGLRPDPSWVSQTTALAAIGQVVTPDLVAREDSLARDIAFIGARLGIAVPPLEAPLSDPVPAALFDDTVMRAVRQLYHRDYVSFGFPSDPAKGR